MSEPIVLNERVVWQAGCFKRVVRYLKGIHSALGVVVIGYTGHETMQEREVFVPKYLFEVRP